METQERILYDVRTAAELLSISHWTVRRMLLDGRLRATKLGRRLLVHRRDLQHFAQKAQQQTKSRPRGVEAGDHIEAELAGRNDS